MNANARRFGSRTFPVVCAITIFICAQIPTPAPFAPIPPQIVSVTPALDSTNAAPHDSLVIVFDQEMAATPLMLSLPPNIVGNFQFTPSALNTSMNPSWSADHKTLTFKPSLAIALNTAVTWTLNPANATVPITSAAGVPLATSTGNYKIASNSGGNPAETCPPVLPTPGAYGFTKSIAYNQTGAGTVNLQAVNPAFAITQISSPSDGPAVTNASLTFPNATTKKVTLTAGFFRLSEIFTTESALNTAYPEGAYTLRFDQTNETERVITFNLPTAPTVIPMIENYAEAQVIDASKDFTLRWNAFSPLPAGGIVRVVIVDEFANRIFLGPNQCVPRTLDPSATSVVIPAGYLRAGFNYTGQLIFTENYYSSTTDVPKMNGNGFVQRTTSFTLKAVNGSVPIPETCDPGTSSGLGSYSITKIIAHTQTSADEVILRTNLPGIFSVTVQSPSLGPIVTNGSITLPGGAQTPLINQIGYYILSGTYDTETALESAYPAGNYTLRFNQTGQPERVIAETMPATPAVVPKIVNYAAAQSIDPTKEFTLQWNPFSPLPSGAFVTVVITDDLGRLVFLAPNPCIPRTLDPSATSVTIPTNYFTAGRKYNGQIVFGGMFYTSTTDVPQMIGSGMVERTTSFTLQAAPAGGVIAAARFTGFRLLPNGHPQFDLTGTPGRAYVILRTANIATVNWGNLPPVTMSGSGTATFEDADPTLTFPAYYQAVGN
ncbi:MAG TPA: Ig-like domain-containing protein [Verrucomicrobiae bacterium]